MTGAVFIADLFWFWTQAGTAGAQFLILFALVMFVALGFVIWAVMWRAPGRRRRSHRSFEEGGLPQRRRRRSSLGRFLRRRKRRRKRRQDRPVNPTLAQIGGLPPKRDEPKPPA